MTGTPHDATLGALQETAKRVLASYSSPNKHATRHFDESKHPIIQSFEKGEDWRWCFVDELLLD